MITYKGYVGQESSLDDDVTTNADLVTTWTGDMLEITNYNYGEYPVPEGQIVYQAFEAESTYVLKITRVVLYRGGEWDESNISSMTAKLYLAAEDDKPTGSALMTSPTFEGWHWIETGCGARFKDVDWKDGSPKDYELQEGTKYVIEIKAAPLYIEPFGADWMAWCANDPVIFPGRSWLFLWGRLLPLPTGRWWSYDDYICLFRNFGGADALIHAEATVWEEPIETTVTTIVAVATVWGVGVIDRISSCNAEMILQGQLRGCVTLHEAAITGYGDFWDSRLSGVRIPFAADLLCQGNLVGALKGNIERCIAILTGNATLTSDLDGGTPIPRATCAAEMAIQGQLRGLVQLCESLLENQALTSFDLTMPQFGASIEVSGFGFVTAFLEGGNLRLKGTIAGVSTVNGDIEDLSIEVEIPPDEVDPWPLPPAPWWPIILSDILGEINAESNISGILTGEWTLQPALPGAGGLDGQSSISGWLMIGDQIRGIAACASTLTGTLSVTRSMSGIIEAQSSLTGLLAGLYGTIAAQSNITGHLELSDELRGVIAAQSVITGSLLLDDEIRVVVAGQSVISGSLSVTRKLAGTITGQSLISGPSSTDPPLSSYFPDFLISNQAIVPYFIQSFLVNNEYVTPYERYPL